MADSTIPADTELLEAWGDLVPFTDYPSQDWPGESRGGITPFSNISDRSDGKFYPVFQNEQDLAQIRGMARRVKSMTPFFESALSALRTYTMGNGPTVAVMPKAKGAKPDEMSKRLQRVVESAIEQIDLPPTLDELHDRAREEGESLTILHRYSQDQIGIEIAEMDCLTEPYGSTELHEWIRDEYGIDCDSFVPSWSFGVLTGKRTTNKPLGYHLVYESGGEDFDFYPESRVVHMRRNVPTNAKRGVSDFLQIFKPLLNEDKLANNVGIGAALQAAIAWVEPMPVGTTQAQAGALGNTDLTRTLATNINNGGGTRSQRASHYAPGTILRPSPGREYKAGPMGAERNGNFELAAQLLLRRIGARWSIPEYMLSADASNANFASTLVAESPFVKAREADQEYMRRVTKSLLWKAVALLWTGEESLEELKQHYDIKVDFPMVQSRDKKALADQLKIEQECGWLSDQTAMTELGRDPDEEISQGAKKQLPPSPFGGVGNPNGGQPNQPQAPDDSVTESTQSAALQGALESVETTEEARAILESMQRSYP